MLERLERRDSSRAARARRIKVLSPSRAGRELLAAVRLAVESAQARMLAPLSPSERAAPMGPLVAFVFRNERARAGRVVCLGRSAQAGDGVRLRGQEIARSTGRLGRTARSACISTSRARQGF